VSEFRCVMSFVKVVSLMAHSRTLYFFYNFMILNLLVRLSQGKVSCNGCKQFCFPFNCELLSKGVYEIL